MTKLFTYAIALFAILTTSDLFATVYTVSNVANRPAQFTSVQAAVDSAAIGDTILITGGGATYAAITTVKPLVFIGEGINGSATTTISSLNLDRFNSSLSSSGTRVYGLVMSTLSINPGFSGSQPNQRVLNDFIFERCQLTSAYYGPSQGELSDLTFRNCIFSGSYAAFLYNVPQTNILYINCVFSGAIIYGNSLNANGNVVIRNSIFMDRTTSIFQNSIAGLVLENNIFYRAEPSGCVGCTFNNNLTYLCNDNALPPTSGNNVGSGNIVNVAPMFASYPQLGAAFSFAHNYALQTGSPAIGSGTNSTNIGLTGGSAPVNNIPQFPKIPAVTQIDIPVSSVPVGGTLQINLRAVTRD
jgi:hypothetical protein